MGRGYLPPGRVVWPRPIKYLGEQVTLRAMKRVTFGTYPNEALRKQGFTPARLQGDWLPDKWLQLFSNELRVPQLAPGFQRRLLKLILDDGEETLALPKQVDRTVDTKLVVATHVNFVRWPRDPENNPLKLNLPVTIVNADKLASVRSRHHSCRRRCRPPAHPPVRPPPPRQSYCCCSCPAREGEPTPCTSPLAWPSRSPQPPAPPQVKRGGYVHNMFSLLGGLPVTVATPDSNPHPHPDTELEPAPEPDADPIPNPTPWP